MATTVGRIVVIKRNGKDGPKFNVENSSYTIGRDEDCDIRIALKSVADRHAKLEITEGNLILSSLSGFPTLVNGKQITSTKLNHLDVFMIADRCFRFESPTSVGNSKIF